MSSSVFYKFKNSREPERILFDGTDITVFELKREIIKASGLGEGTDFDLHLYPEDDPKAEYDDDTTAISRSSTVIAVRRPAARGHGRAARYVSGTAPVRAIKKENRPAVPVTSGAPSSDADAEAAFLAESAQVWDQQKETLSQAKRVNVHHKKKNAHVPEHEPPPAYICFRCNEKGHWIQACPTNNIEGYKAPPRTKRTTGIPTSFLKKVDKPVDEENARGVMLNADGEYVQVLTDDKAWEKFQAKSNVSKAAAASADAVSQEIRERGLECPIDKRKFVSPVKTPCCGKTYCFECIDSALADGDLVCPNCNTKDVLMDDLVPDEDMIKSIKAYEAEKAAEKLEREEQAKVAEQSASPKNELENPVPSVEPSAPSSNDVAKSLSSEVLKATTPGATSDTESTSSSKKRKSPPTDIQPPTAPKAMRQQKVVDPTQDPVQFLNAQMKALENGNIPMPNMSMPMMSMMPMMPMMGGAMPMGNGNMPMPMMGNFNTNPMMNNFNPYMNQNIMNPMGMGGPMGMPMHSGLNPMVNNGYGYANGGDQNWGGYNDNNSNNNSNNNGANGGGLSNNQQQGDYNDAYDRQPVNPRHRNRKNRAPDFRYV